MKRDMELIRKLLIFFEEKQGPEHVEKPRIDGYSEMQIATHLVLMHEAGFLRCESVRSKTDATRVIYVIPFELTWQGYEFLQSIRDDTLWAKLRKEVIIPTASWTFATMAEWLKDEIRKSIESRGF